MSATAIDPIAALQAKLLKYPQILYTIGGRRIDIHPVDECGFEISLIEHEPGARYTVAFAGWHEEFADSQEALECVIFGLSQDSRLQVWSRGHVDYRWTLEERRGSDWVAVSTVGLLLFPFWRRPEVRYLQNHALKAA